MIVPAKVPAKLILGIALLLGSLLGCRGDVDKEALQQKVSELETRLQEMEDKQARDRQQIVETLGAVSERLDALLQRMPGRGLPLSSEQPVVDSNSPEPEPSQPDGSAALAGNTDSTGSANKPAPAKPLPSEDDSAMRWLVIALSAALVILVLVLVFFPNRLRRTVPQMEYSVGDAGVSANDFGPEAEEVAEDSLEVPAIPVVKAAPLSQPNTKGQPKPESKPSRDGKEAAKASNGHSQKAGPASARPTSQRQPRPNQCPLPIPDGQTQRQSVLKILAAEPQVLRLPAPEFGQVAGRLQLTYFTMPNLSAEDSDLLQGAILARVQALRSQNSRE